MKKWFILLLLPVLLFGCKEKKKQLTDNDTVDVSDFIDFFDEIKLPVLVEDSSFHKKENDSAAIGYKIFSSFVPDSLLNKQFGKGPRPKIYPAGKVSTKKQETYLFIKAITPSKKVAYVLVFDAGKKFTAGIPLVTADKDEPSSQSALLDKKLTLTLNRQKRNAAGLLVYKKSAYIYNNVGVFTLILTESNDKEAVRNVMMNPIDTLSRKNKLSGDYIQDRMNLVSVRDGKNASELTVFVHFEKNDGECKGELKGNAKITAPNKAVYRQQGDQCMLEFIFSDNKVSIREEQGCGSHRDIKCFFEGSFIKRRPLKPLKPLKKKQ